MSKSIDSILELCFPATKWSSFGQYKGAGSKREIIWHIYHLIPTRIDSRLFCNTWCLATPYHLPLCLLHFPSQPSNPLPQETRSTHERRDAGKDNLRAVATAVTMRGLALPRKALDQHLAQGTRYDVPNLPTGSQHSKHHRRVHATLLLTLVLGDLLQPVVPRRCSSRRGMTTPPRPVPDHITP